jgi:uncharacterized protein YndB with AHSA1/START domain
MTTAVPPVRKTVVVNADPRRAFEFFTTQTEAWWPAHHTIAAFKRKEIVLEPRAGGRWLERGPNGEECQWGRVEAWDPPKRILLIWQINAEWAFDPGLATEVEVTFTPQAGGRTKVDLEHRLLERMGVKAEMVRGMIDAPGGWQGLLEAYVARVDGAVGASQS